MVDKAERVCQWCIEYLLANLRSEMGILRCAVSQVDVRSLKNQIASQAESLIAHKLDVYVVAEVMQSCLRDMKPSLLAPCADAIIQCAENFEKEAYTSTVQSWLVNFPPDKYELVERLFNLLHRIAFISEREADLRTLAYTIAPSLCCSEKCAFMSLRHMKDLDKIRPAVAFMIKHWKAIFTAQAKALVMVNTATLELSMPVPFEAVLPEERSPTLVRPNLQIFIPTKEESKKAAAVSATPRSMGAGHTAEEWQILEHIVMGTSSTLLDLDFQLKDLSGAESARILAALAPVSRAARAAGTTCHAGETVASSPSRCSDRSPVSQSSPRHRPSLRTPGASTPTRQVPGRPDLPRTPHARKRAAVDLLGEDEGEAADDAPGVGIALTTGTAEAVSSSNTTGSPSATSVAAGVTEGVVKYTVPRTEGAECGAMCVEEQSVESPDLTVTTAPSTPTEGRHPHQEVPSSHPVLLCEEFRVLLEEKKAMKSQLRGYDRDFQQRWGREPRKSDKEAVRPLYNVYNEIKRKLGSMRHALGANLPHLAGAM